MNVKHTKVGKYLDTKNDIDLQTIHNKKHIFCACNLKPGCRGDIKDVTHQGE